MGVGCFGFLDVKRLEPRRTKVEGTGEAKTRNKRV